MNWRDAIKGAVERLVVRAHQTAPSWMAPGKSVAVLAFHNVVPDGEQSTGDRSLHMPSGLFAELIAELSRRFGIVSLDDALSQRHRGGRMRFAITFDDAYHGAVTHGLDVLEHAGVPSTTFVAPQLFGCACTWWDHAAHSAGGVIPATRRDEWLDGPDAGRHRTIGAQLGAEWSWPAAFRIADEKTVLAAARRPGVMLASHTWSHPNLAALANSGDAVEEVNAELQKPLDWASVSRTPFLRLLAYPYGRWNEPAASAAEQAGYAGAFRVDGGALSRKASPAFALPRINVPASMRAGGVLWRATGWSD